MGITRDDLYDAINQLAEAVYKHDYDLRKYSLSVSPDLANIMFNWPKRDYGGMQLYAVETDYGSLDVKVYHNLNPGTLILLQDAAQIGVYQIIGDE